MLTKQASEFLQEIHSKTLFTMFTMKKQRRKRVWLSCLHLTTSGELFTLLLTVCTLYRIS